MNSVVLYGDVSPNVIDGSSIWLISASEVLARVFDEVHLLLKAPLANKRLIGSVSQIPNIVVHEPRGATIDNPLDSQRAASQASELVETHGASAVVVRGMDACNAFCQVPRISKVLWSYVTDLPFPPERISRNNLNRLNRIAANSHRMFSQTEASRSYLEAICPNAAGKTVLMRPMIPNVEPSIRNYEGVGTASNPLRIIYSGKFAKPWKTLEMLGLPRSLAKEGITAELVVVGDKYNRAADEPGWVSRMKSAIEEAKADSNSGVQWLGALNRESSLEQIKSAHLGLGWRTRELDSSLEISTKALEYSLCATVPILNRTADHERLYSLDYPFFVDALTGVEELAKMIKRNIGLIKENAQNVTRIATNFTMANAAAYLEEAFQRGGALNSSKREVKPQSSGRTRLVIASHDMKFMGELMDFLSANPHFEVRQDQWETLHTHDVQHSKALAGWADVVFCEWAGPALKWYSEHKSRGTRLVSRLHRFEMNGKWMTDVRWENVDHMVFVSDFIRDEVVEKFGIEKSKTHIIPNGIDALDLNREKLKDAQFHIGMVGYVPFLKRPDRALDLLESLLERDPRFVLHLKGRMPWDYPYEWNKPLQKQAYLELFSRISSSPLLEQKVVFEPFSADIASWHRKIGFTLSPSSLESFHLAPAEGMAAGTIPLVWPRPGSKGIFGRHVVRDIDEAVDRILTFREPENFRAESERVKAESQKWDFYALCQKWESLLGESTKPVQQI